MEREKSDNQGREKRKRRIARRRRGLICLGICTRVPAIDWMLFAFDSVVKNQNFRFTQNWERLSKIVIKVAHL